MIDHIIAALNMTGRLTDSRMERYHYSNYAVDGVLDGDQMIHLATSYEDGNIDGVQEAERVANVIEDICPGQFVLLHTGDYIVADDPGVYSQHDRDQDTYDPWYSYYLVPRPYFDEKSDELDMDDNAWRTAAQARANFETAKVTA